MAYRRIFFHSLGLLASAAAGLAATAGASASHAASATLTVSARVLKFVRIHLVGQPTKLEISAGDIARGYIDVPDAGHVVLRSNSPDGFSLEFSALPDLVQRATVSLDGREIDIGPAGAAVVENKTGRVMYELWLPLKVRLVLSEQAQEGVYPWPIRLTVAAL